MYVKFNLLILYFFYIFFIVVIFIGGMNFFLVDCMVYKGKKDCFKILFLIFVDFLFFWGYEF